MISKNFQTIQRFYSKVNQISYFHIDSSSQVPITFKNAYQFCILFMFTTKWVSRETCVNNTFETLP